MESYVEISYLIQALTMMISCMLAGYLSLQPLSLKQMLVYSLLLPFAACMLWIRDSIYYMLIIEALLFLCYFRIRWKTYLYVLTLRFLFSFTWYAFYQGGFHNFQYFYPMRSPLFLIVLELTGLLMLYRKWNYWLGKMNYVYECKLSSISCRKWMKGYLDSGNMLMIEDVPVIFIDQAYQTYFKKENIQYVVMETMGNNTPVKCYESRLLIRGLAEKKVFVCCENHLQLPLHCQILLNVNLWLG